MTQSPIITREQAADMMLSYLEDHPDMDGHDAFYAVSEHIHRNYRNNFYGEQWDEGYSYPFLYDIILGAYPDRLS